MSTETTTVTIGEATTVTVSANTGPRGPAGADGAGGGVTDGDKGDITVSGSGATWTIDDNSVTLAKLADIATASIIGRTTAATGDPEVLTATQVRALLNVEDGATADQSAAEILTAIKTVDGTGSGLDADTVDGVEAAALAPLASPTFTGVPAAPTATAGANSTQIATTAYVDNATSSAVVANVYDDIGAAYPARPTADVVVWVGPEDPEALMGDDDFWADTTGAVSAEPYIDRTGATTGQIPVLQADSTLAFADAPAGGGAWTDLGYQTGSPISWTGLGSYKQFMLILEDVHRTTATGTSFNRALDLRCNGDTTNHYQTNTTTSTAAPPAASGVFSTVGIYTDAGPAKRGTSGVIHLHAPQTAHGVVTGWCRTVAWADVTGFNSIQRSLMYAAGTLTDLQLESASTGTVISARRLAMA